MSRYSPRIFSSICAEMGANTAQPFGVKRSIFSPDINGGQCAGEMLKNVIERALILSGGSDHSR
jgi:hypothetical protein